MRLAVRGAYTNTLDVSDMDRHALTADVSVGRRLTVLRRVTLGAGVALGARPSVQLHVGSVAF